MLNADGSRESMTLSDAVMGELVRRDLVMNVIRGGVWGSFRHLPLTTGNLNQNIIASMSKFMNFVLLCFVHC